MSGRTRRATKKKDEPMTATVVETKPDVPRKRQMPTEADIAEALRAGGGIKSLALNYLKEQNKGIDRKTLNKKIKESEYLQEVEYETTENLLDTAEQNLFSLVEQGDRTALIFYLKCKGKERGYIERQQTEVTGANGEPLIHNKVVVLELPNNGRDNT